MVTSKKRISIFMPSLFGAGGQRSMLNLAHGIAARGYGVDLVLAQAEGEFMDDVRKPVRIVDLKASRVMTSIPALVSYLRREQPDAMLSVFGYVNIIAILAWRLAGVPTRLFVNEQNTVSLEAGNAASWSVRITPRLMKHFYPWANGIVVVSGGVRDDMVQMTNIPKESINVIYNPSVIGAEVLEKAQASLYHPWFKPGQPPVIVAVGRLQIQKDYPMLLHAFAQMRRARPARLIILGEGKERPLLEQIIKELGLGHDVSLPGFVANPYAYMANAQLFALSSRWEGLPTVLIEALCCGTPAVATDCPSGPREILQNGRYGRLVPVGDVDAFAHAMRVSLDNHTRSAPVESWQPYELETVTKQYLNLLLEKQQTVSSAMALPSEQTQPL